VTRRKGKVASEPTSKERELMREKALVRSTKRLVNGEKTEETKNLKKTRKRANGRNIKLVNGDCKRGRRDRA